MLIGLEASSHESERLNLEAMYRNSGSQGMPERTMGWTRWRQINWRGRLATKTEAA